MSLNEPPHEELLDLFEELRRNGFNVGMQQYVAAQRLLVRLAAESGWLDRPERLATLFAPIVCTTPEEQESFPRHYERWLQTRPSIFAPEKSREEVTLDIGPRRDTEPERKPPAAWNRWLLLLLALPLLLSAFVLILLNSPFIPQQLTLNVSVVNDSNKSPINFDTTLEVVHEDRLLRKYSSSTGQFTVSYFSDELPLQLVVTIPDKPIRDIEVSTPIADLTIEKPTTSVIITTTSGMRMTTPDGVFYVPPGPPGLPTWWDRLRDFYSRSAFWVVAALGAVVLLGGLLWLGRQARRLELRKWRTRNRVKTDQLIVKGAAEQLSRILSLRRTAQELRRHRPSDVQDLDVSQTIEGTIRRGLFTPTYAARKSLPEYLILIDRVGFDDQQARFVDEAVKRLAHNDVYIERYYFQGDPRVCTRNEARARRHTVGTRVNSKDAPQSGNVTLQELTAKYPNHNLLVFSDGAGLFDPLTGRAQDWIGMFSPWSTRVFLTSELQPDDYMEWALNKSGFMVLPADRAGLAAASELIQTGIRFKGQASRVRPLPRLLRQRQNRWLEEHPPAPSTIEGLCGELKEFLGGEGYYWLSACAVYPMLYWDLTLYLGYRLVGRDRFDEKLTTLLRLPWFRHGSMPNWLRARLVTELPHEQERAIRAALRELLLTSIRNPDGFVLPIVRDPVQEDPRAWRRAWGRLARRVAEWRDTAFLLDYLKSGQRDSTFTDHVLLAFIAGRKPNRLALHLPEEVYAAFAPKPPSTDLRLLGLAAAFLTLAGLVLLPIASLAVFGFIALLAGFIFTGVAITIDMQRQFAHFQTSTLRRAASEQQTSSKKTHDRQWSYVLGRPLRANERLYGRDELLADIDAHLRDFSSVNIVGERRSGKTSLLNHLQAMYERRDITSGDFVPLLIRIDLQEVGPDVRRFYGIALRELQKATSKLQGEDGGTVLDQLLKEFNLPRPISLDSDRFRSILEALTKKYAFFKLVIVVDEFEALLALPVAADLPRFFAQLRAMMSADLMTMVIASVHPLSEYSSDPAIFDGLTSPFANYFTTFRLKPLDDTEAEELLRGVSDDQLTDREITEAYRWAGGQTCLLQVAAAAWFEAKRKGRPEEWVYQRREELKLQSCASSTTAINATRRTASQPLTGPWARLKGLPGDIWIIAIATLIARAARLIVPFMPLYLTVRFGFSEAEVGRALLLLGIGGIISAPASGRLCDTFGELRIMKLSLLLSSVALIFLPLAQSPTSTLISLFLWALFSEAFSSASLTALNSLVTPEQRIASQTLNRKAATLGMALGPAVGGIFVIAYRSSDQPGATSAAYAVLFLAGGVTSFMAFILLTLSLKVKSRKSLENMMIIQKQPRGLLKLRLISDPRFMLFLIAFFPTLLVFFQQVSTLPLFLTQELRLTEAHYGSIFLVNGVLIIFLEIYLVTWTAGWSYRRALSTGAFLLAVGYGSLAFATNYFYVLAAVVVWTLGEMLLFPRAFAYIAKIAPSDRLGEYIGILSLSFSLSMAIAPWLGIAVSQRFGSLTLWTIAFLCGSLSAITLLKGTKVPQP